MALSKKITLENGVIVNYHRVVSVNSIVNNNTSIEIASYTDDEQRQKEIRYQELQKKSSNDELLDEEIEELEKGICVYIETDYMNIDYDENMNVNNAYKYLKTLDKFKDAKDV